MAQSSNYSKEQVSKMRQDAINQANSMYQKSKNKNNSFNYNNNNFHNTKKDNTTYDKTANQQQKNDFNFSGISLDSILSGLGLDKENVIIIVLILLLYKEKADYKLILSLIYLLI